MAFAPALALTASIGSALVGTAGTIISGMATANAASYQAAVANANAKIAQQNAAREGQAGDQAAEQNDMKNRAALGEQLASQGASGIDVGGGSAFAVRRSAEILGRLDTQTIKANSQKSAYNDLVEAANQKDKASLFSMQSNYATIGTYLGAGGSLLGGASSVSDKWLDYKQKGLL